MKRLIALAATAVIVTGHGSPAAAMTMRVAGDQVILSGRVLPTDGDQFRDLIAANPTVTTIVLWDSPGGAARGNRDISTIIAGRKLVTAVAGYCISACAMIFLSGTERLFSDGTSIETTSLGFHGSYRADHQLAQQPRLDRLKDLVSELTGGKANREIVDRWLHLPEDETIRFLYPRGDRSSAYVFHCAGGSANRGNYSRCDPIPNVDALSMGIITSTRLLHVNR